jgi:hypothetical protein
MNYGETFAYWYLRLNGFFPLRNFVLHRLSQPNGRRENADVDLLAIRFPFVHERYGDINNEGQWDDDWDRELTKGSAQPDDDYYWTYRGGQNE